MDANSEINHNLDVSDDSQMTYQELEAYIDECILELEEMQSIYTQKTNQLNISDRFIFQNKQIITELDAQLQNTKTTQDVLETELELIDVQIKQIEESLGPLEKQYENIVCVNTTRSDTYTMLEIVNMELRQNSECIEQIIRVLNQDSMKLKNEKPDDKVGDVLNKLLGWLEWIDSQTNLLSKLLDDIETLIRALKTT
ncbi:nuclear pore glycoprotein p62-like [Scaptodrosophila lebanonensis]|uniref:Nuclear pore glycoprotein p62-like n=1 Tax=Drosophila lebanonensis TaxID=7225 RepID=A0A6J2TR42_DROLE|nr:nuclear pore glycoprotein p62-like [Scaptodrosophila lebanonensis]